MAAKRHPPSILSNASASSSYPHPNHHNVVGISKRFLRLATILAIMVGTSFLSIIGCHFYYRNRLSSISSSATKPANINMNDFQFIHQHRGQEDAPVIFTPEGPLNSCPLLKECFPGEDSIYRDQKSCTENIGYLLRYYDNTIAVYQGQVVAFMSCHVEVDPDNPLQVAILIYNVCVRPDVRGHGLARRLVEEGTKAVVEWNKLQDKRVLLGLDVEWPTALSAEAFNLYAKMGFFRAWQPCRSVGDLDWRPIFNDPTAASIRHPLSEILSRPDKYLKDELKGEASSFRLRSRSKTSPRKMAHFCMFKFYNESWLTLGRQLRSAFVPEDPPEKPSSS